MSTIKKVEAVSNRIIAKVQSGDFTPEHIEHMIESLLKSRDKRIVTLQKRAKPFQFILSESDIAGALKNCIQSHGNITPAHIGSATKRIFKACIKQVGDQPLSPMVTDMNAEPTVTYFATTQHKLTVARDGSIRIKIAEGTVPVVSVDIVKRLTEIARVAIHDSIAIGTLRGKFDPGEQRLTLFNNSKTKRFHYDV